MNLANIIVAIYTSLTAYQPDPNQLSALLQAHDYAGVIQVEAQSVTKTVIACLPLVKQVAGGLTEGMTSGIAQVAQASTTTNQ